MTWDDLKTPVVLTILGFFAAGWLALYWITASRVSAAEAQSIALHGQQEGTLQGYEATIQLINQQLTNMNGTLGKIEERTQNLYHSLEKLDGSVQNLNGSVQRLEGSMQGIQNILHQIHPPASRKSAQ